MGKLIDLTGQRFNYLTVLSRNLDRQIELGSSEAYWNCLCDCGNKTVVQGRYLRSGATKSCGCWNLNRIASMGKSNKKTNSYDLVSQSYGIGYTMDGHSFIFDKEDFEIIKDICWHLQKGYLVGISNGKKINMHKLILNMEESTLVIDHINGDKCDNRKSKLRICTQHQNSMNRKINSNNKSGYKGVSFDKRTQKWQVRIKYNYKNIYLGKFDCLEDAIIARINAEKLYFGEYSRNSEG